MVNNNISRRGFFKPLLFYFLVVYITPKSYSKDFTVYRDKIYSKKVHLHFNTPVSISPRGHTDFKHPDFKQEFFPSVNFKFGLTGLYNFNAQYSLSMGMNMYGISFYSMRHQYFIPEKYLPLLVDPIPEYYQGDIYPIQKFDPYLFFWSMPLNFIHRIPISNKLDFRYGFGIDLKLYSSTDMSRTDAMFDMEGKQLAKIYKLNYKVGNDKKNALKSDALFSTGINRYLENNKYINCNFFISVPMYMPIRGEFIFLPDSPYEARGTFKKYDLAFGFEFNYIFTFVKREKRLKAKEQKLE